MKTGKASIITKLVVLILIVYATVTLISLKERVEKASKSEGDLRAQVESLQSSNDYLQYEIDNSDDPETIAEIARDKLGLVLPGERIFYDISN